MLGNDSSPSLQHPQDPAAGQVTHVPPQGPHPWWQQTQLSSSHVPTSKNVTAPSSGDLAHHLSNTSLPRWFQGDEQQEFSGMDSLPAPCSTSQHGRWPRGRAGSFIFPGGNGPQARSFLWVCTQELLHFSAVDVMCDVGVI